jgi:hypothetical protein
MTKCPWCVHPYDSPEAEAAAPETLCRPHLAEYEGMSETELDRMDSEQWKDQQ